MTREVRLPEAPFQEEKVALSRVAAVVAPLVIPLLRPQVASAQRVAAPTAAPRRFRVERRPPRPAVARQIPEREARRRDVVPAAPVAEALQLFSAETLELPAAFLRQGG